MEILPQSSCIGAELRGLDLALELDDSQLRQIKRALLDHQVVFFRDQQLSPRQYTGFAERLGKLQDYLFAHGLEGYPCITEIIKTETETEGFGCFWHSDSTYLEHPPKYTLLYAREVPERGGDTLFADMYAACDNLSDGLRAQLESLNAINSASVVPRDEDIYAEVKSRNAGESHRCAKHPVIRTHDETGRKALYVNSIHTLSFDGMSRAESLPLLEYLYRQVERPEYAFRLQWRRDTLAIWDNRCTQHYALNDYHGYRRVMHRIIVEGPRPQ